jgi:mannose-6-phosphate isomerase-like protein (cupin superfamily)
MRIGGMTSEPKEKHMTTQPSTAQRIFTTADYVDPNAERTLNSAYRDEDFSAIVEWINPGEVFEDPHSHPKSSHVFVVMEGEGEALVGNGTWKKIVTGQFVVNPRGKVHAMRNTSSDHRLVWVCVHMPNPGPYVVEPRTETDD